MGGKYSHLAVAPGAPLPSSPSCCTARIPFRRTEVSPSGLSCATVTPAHAAPSAGAASSRPATLGPGVSSWQHPGRARTHGSQAASSSGWTAIRRSHSARVQQCLPVVSLLQDSLVLPTLGLINFPVLKGGVGDGAPCCHLGMLRGVRHLDLRQCWPSASQLAIRRVAGAGQGGGWLCLDLDLSTPGRRTPFCSARRTKPQTRIPNHEPRLRKPPLARVKSRDQEGTAARGPLSWAAGG